MRCVRSFVGHSDYVHCVALSASNGQLVSGSEDGTVKFWGMQ
jgi:WD40 repeat protein